jgi:HSP20 family protein
MSVIKISIQTDIERLHERFRSMADDLFRMAQPVTRCRCGWLPAIDLYETEEGLFMAAALGGVDIGSIELTLNSNYIKLSGYRRSPLEDAEKRHFFQMEIEYGQFERIIKLPFPINPEDIKVEYMNGLLVIKMNRM